MKKLEKILSKIELVLPYLWSFLMIGCITTFLASLFIFLIRVLINVIEVCI
jgi:hypothetical protein